MRRQRLSVVPGSYAVARLPAEAPVPGWAAASRSFASVTRTADELSIVCSEADVPAGARAERGWALIRLHGPIPFDQAGVLASLAAPLAAAGVGIFAISTFDTDYLLVKSDQLPKAREALVAAGHDVSGGRQP